METTNPKTPAPSRRLKTPKEFLSEIFQTRCERNPSYSLSAYARDLGISVSTLSRFMNGRRPVTLKFGMQVAAVLGLSPEETNLLIYSVMQSATKTSKISRRVKERIAANVKAAQATDAELDPSEVLYTTVEMERFRAISEWYHLALLNIVSIENFDTNPTSIAKHLGISEQEARSALDRLFALGLLEENAGKIVRTQRHFNVKTQKSEVAVRKFHQQMIAKATHELEKIDAESFQRRLINGITFSCGQDQIEAIKDRIDRFQDEILMLARASTPDSVYQMNLQFFPLALVSSSPISSSTVPSPSTPQKKLSQGEMS